MFGTLYILQIVHVRPHKHLHSKHVEVLGFLGDGREKTP